MAIYDVSTSEKKANPALVAGGTLYADSPIGTILPFGGASAPSGWFLCQGQAVSRTTYSELFAVIGTSFGAGDGSTTFNIPDMRESVPKGAGETGKTVGAHVKSGGLAVGEFLDDRVQNFKLMTSENGGTDTWIDGYLVRGRSSTKMDRPLTGNYPLSLDARAGATTEVKSVGVNYIIKAKMIAVPADFLAKVDEAVSEAITVDYKAVPGSAVNAGAVADYTFDITKSGYTPLGIVGTIINAGEKCALVSSRVNSSSQATVRIINTGTSATTPSSIVIYILYIKTT